MSPTCEDHSPTQRMTRCVANHQCHTQDKFSTIGVFGGGSLTPSGEWRSNLRIISPNTMHTGMAYSLYPSCCLHPWWRVDDASWGSSSPLVYSSSTNKETEFLACVFSY